MFSQWEITRHQNYSLALAFKENGKLRPLTVISASAQVLLLRTAFDDLSEAIQKAEDDYQTQIKNLINKNESLSTRKPSLVKETNEQYELEKIELNQKHQYFEELKALYEFILAIREMTNKPAYLNLSKEDEARLNNLRRKRQLNLIECETRLAWHQSHLPAIIDENTDYTKTSLKFSGLKQFFLYYHYELLFKSIKDKMEFQFRMETQMQEEFGDKFAAYNSTSDKDLAIPPDPLVSNNDDFKENSISRENRNIREKNAIKLREKEKEEKGKLATLDHDEEVASEFSNELEILVLGGKKKLSNLNFIPCFSKEDKDQIREQEVQYFIDQIKMNINTQIIQTQYHLKNTNYGASQRDKKVQAWQALITSLNKKTDDKKFVEIINKWKNGTINNTDNQKTTTHAKLIAAHRRYSIFQFFKKTKSAQALQAITEIARCLDKQTAK